MPYLDEMCSVVESLREKGHLIEDQPCEDRDMSMGSLLDLLALVVDLVPDINN